MTRISSAAMRVADRKTTDTPGRQALLAWLAADRRRTNRWLAKILDVHYGAISEWSRGLSRPNVPNAFYLFKLAGIPIDAWLTDGERTTLVLVEVHAHRIASEPVEPRVKRDAPDKRQLAMPWSEVA